MTFRFVDELLTAHEAGEVRQLSSLDMRLLGFARGVAVYEMPVRADISDPAGNVGNGVLAALAEAAMAAAATTTVPDEAGEAVVLTRELRARFRRQVTADAGATLRAEAIVVRTDEETVDVEAVILCEGEPVATFEASCRRGLSRQQIQAA